MRGVRHTLLCLLVSLGVAFTSYLDCIYVSIRDGRQALPVKVSVLGLTDSEQKQVHLFRAGKSAKYEIAGNSSVTGSYVTSTCLIYDARLAESITGLKLTVGNRVTVIDNLRLVNPDNRLNRLNIFKRTYDASDYGQLRSKKFIDPWFVARDTSLAELYNGDYLFFCIPPRILPAGENSVLGPLKGYLNYAGDWQTVARAFDYWYLLLALLIFLASYYVDRLADLANRSRDIVDRLLQRLHLVSAAIVPLMVFAWNAVYLTPVLQTAFCSDDLYNHNYLAKVVRSSGVSFYDFCVKKTASDIGHFIENGRLFPLNSVILNCTTYFLVDDLAYRIVNLALLLLCVVLFYNLIQALTGNKMTAALMAASVPLFLQIRDNYNDPVISMYFEMQVLFILFILSMTCLLKYLEKEHYGYLLVSLISYLSMLLTYEIAYPLTLGHFFLLARHYRKSGSLSKWTVVYPLVFIIMTATTLLVRANASQIQGSVSVGFDPVAVTATFFKQLAAAVPMSYSLGSANQIVIVIVLALIFRLYLLGRLRVPWVNDLLCVGLIIWIGPAVPIALVPKYQAELKIGLGALPVFVQYFGFLMFLAGSVYSIHLEIISTRYRNLFLGAVLVLVVGNSAANFIQNQHAIKRINGSIVSTAPDTLRQRL